MGNAGKIEVGEPKYPHVCVQLSGEDGNVFMIVGRVMRALRREKVPGDEIDAFGKAVMASDSYDAALRTVMSYVNVN
jgi:hypothetical protein